jgi:hypothetical protein
MFSKSVVAIVTGHAPVRRHLYIMGLFIEDLFCRMKILQILQDGD